MLQDFAERNLELHWKWDFETTSLNDWFLTFFINLFAIAAGMFNNYKNNSKFQIMDREIPVANRIVDKKMK